MDKKIVAVVVTYNRKELLKECIEALISQTLKTEIMVIDNASTDHTEDFIKSYSQNGQIIYKNTGANLGGAGGFNFGIKEAMKYDYDDIWIMDDDTIPQINALEELVRAGSVLDNKYGFLASTVLWKDGSFCLMNKPGISKDWVINNSYSFLKDGLVKIKHASFVSIFFNKRVVKQIGLPIKEFFIWNDDFEYTTRISDKYDSYLVSKSIVEHKMKSNIMADITIDDLERISRYKFSFRNEYFTIKKYGWKSKFKFYIKVLELIFKIIFGKCNYKGKRIGAILNGVISGWFFHPDIERV